MKRDWIRKWFPVAGLMLALILGAVGASAQHGYPLVGSWHGTWTPEGAGADGVRDITLVINWDGDLITGIINPGYNSMKIENASLDASNGWKLHFEADTNNDSGPVERVVLDGHLEHAASVNREIVGTWTQGSVSGPVHFTRDY